MKSANEVRKEDNLYLIGPFWIVGNSIEEINQGNFTILAEKFLVDFQGNYVNRVPKSQFTHAGIWKTKYERSYNREYDYYPRGRIAAQGNQLTVNLPRGLNESLIIARLAKEFDFDSTLVTIKYTDPTSGAHYSFRLN